MKIDFVEISNFRKLKSVRIDIADEQTIFVGANNSGKTSAMSALRYFLIDRDLFSIHDLTLSHWHQIDDWGTAWEKAIAADSALPKADWLSVLPALDIWLSVAETEYHHVQGILPSLDWSGGQLGVRLQLEPKSPEVPQQEYLTIRAANRKAQAGAAASASGGGATAASPPPDVKLWPVSLTDFLAKRLGALFTVKAYVLDPAQLEEPKVGIAKPQILPSDAEPLDGNPLRGLICVHEIGAQRGFSQDNHRGDEEEAPAVGGQRRLSDQLKRYYSKHLDPFETPNSQDLDALRAIDAAQEAFDGRLRDGFADALKELETLNYPGVNDPSIAISTRVRPLDGLNHDSAVRYVVCNGIGGTKPLSLPEQSNGLGYQNLISMVFRLMSYRDAWLKVKKAKPKAERDAAAGDEGDVGLPPLHLVLVEEPEAHLHAQVQQVFIRQAYKILRNNEGLGKNKTLTTQLIVSTHSSHIAHECEFSALRYFRRLPPDTAGVPTSSVINLTRVFGEQDETKRFVTRYLRITHADLLFADAAVLMEGPAERILVPYFVREKTKFALLNQAYITWLEIGGSHAHRMKMLIEHIGIPTLVITDLDPMGADGKSSPPVRGAAQKTRNTTLKTWCPVREDIDALLDLSPDDKCKTYKDERFSIRSAYQNPIKIAFKGSASIEAIPYTFEDALLYENIELFSTMNGTGLIAKFKNAITEATSVPDLSERVHKILKDGGKAAFAMDMLELKDPSKLNVPGYIDSGLEWLTTQVGKRQKELLGGEGGGIPGE